MIKQTNGAFGMLKRNAVKVGAVAGLALATTSQAALTVDPADIYGGVESSFDAAALIGVAVAVVMWTIRYVKKGLRAA